MRDALARREEPVWRQALEGIGLVIVLAAVVGVIGFLLAVVVALLF